MTLSRLLDAAHICPNGGTLFRNRCYWIGSEGTLPWKEADAACQKEFGETVHLPVIRDAEMNVSIIYHQRHLF